jgi:hypothetical protein
MSQNDEINDFKRAGRNCTLSVQRLGKIFFSGAVRLMFMLWVANERAPKMNQICVRSLYFIEIVVID